MTKFFAAPILAAALALAAPVRADSLSNSFFTKCPSFICAYDVHNTLVGVPLSDDTAVRNIKQNWYQLYMNRNGLSVNWLVYYKSNDCSDHPLIATETFPPLVLYDGMSFWGALTGGEIITVNSYEYGNPPYCEKNFSSQANVAPAIRLETRTFYPPLTIR